MVEDDPVALAPRPEQFRHEPQGTDVAGERGGRTRGDGAWSEEPITADHV